MFGRKRVDVPESLARGRERFEAWRRSRKVGARIPDSLWSLAVTLAESHGLSRTASALKLDDYSLKDLFTEGSCCRSKRRFELDGPGLRRIVSNAVGSFDSRVRDRVGRRFRREHQLDARFVPKSGTGSVCGACPRFRSTIPNPGFAQPDLHAADCVQRNAKR